MSNQNDAANVTAPLVSVVVPVAKGDETWKELLGDLSALPPGSEVILSGPQASRFVEPGLGEGVSVRWIDEASGRAGQQNRGAEAARGRFVWFLHADSRLPPRAVAGLEAALRSEPRALHYFDLVFRGDGPGLIWLNTLGAFLRSRLFKMPFGDQGLCLARELWRELGGFPAGLPYGEDHVFVWRALQKGIRVRSTGIPIYTSARKYQRHGWLTTTVKHVYLTWRQAAPEIVTLCKVKLKNIRRQA